MKLRGITFVDTENIDSIDVTLTRDEAALMYAVLGDLSPAAVTHVIGSGYDEALDGLCEICVPLNMVYDGGVDEVVKVRGAGRAMFERQRVMIEEQS